MLDIHFIREHKEEVRANLTKRQHLPYLEMFDSLIKDDVEYRKILQDAEGLRGKRNQLTQEVAKVKDLPVEKQKLISQSKMVGEQIVQAEKTQLVLKEK